MQKVRGDHEGFVPLGNLAEEMFCGVRSVFDGVRSINFSRCTVRVQGKLDGMSLTPPCTASYSSGRSSLSFQICLLAQGCRDIPYVEKGYEESSAGEDSASVHCSPHPLHTTYIIQTIILLQKSRTLIF